MGLFFFHPSILSASFSEVGGRKRVLGGEARGEEEEGGGGRKGKGIVRSPLRYAVKVMTSSGIHCVHCVRTRSVLCVRQQFAHGLDVLRDKHLARHRLTH